MNQAKWWTYWDHAFNLAEAYRTLVILFFDEIVGHIARAVGVFEKNEMILVNRLRMVVNSGVDYHPYLPREDVVSIVEFRGKSPLQRDGTDT